MARTARSEEKPRQYTLRIPKEYGEAIDRLKENEGTDSTVIILRAIKFWLKTGGNATMDYDLLGRMTALETELKKMRDEEHNRFAEHLKEKKLEDEEHKRLLAHQKELEEKDRQIERLTESLNKLQEAFDKQQNTIEKLVELIGK